jgi:hypothetical protein
LRGIDGVARSEVRAPAVLALDDGECILTVAGLLAESIGLECLLDCLGLAGNNNRAPKGIPT